MPYRERQGGTPDASLPSTMLSDATAATRWVTFARPALIGMGPLISRWARPSSTLAPTYSSGSPRLTLIMRDIIFRVSFADCILVTDCRLDTVLSHAHLLSETYFLSDRRPHQLIINFPHCTLSILFLSDVFLTRRTLRLPSTIKPFLDQRSSLMRHF
jgi:hypothetical protein